MPEAKVSATSVTLADRNEDITVIFTAADLIANLPKSHSGSKGNRVKVVVGTASTGVGVQVEPKGTDTIKGTGITASSGKAIINTGATDAVGDSLTVVSAGNGDWYITEKIGTWAREA